MESWSPILVPLLLTPKCKGRSRRAVWSWESGSCKRSRRRVSENHTPWGRREPGLLGYVREHLSVSGANRKRSVLIFWLKSTKCHHILGVCGSFFCSILLEIVFWCWDERISFSHEQRSWQGQIYWKTYTYVCICISIYFCTVLLITHQRLLYFNTGALLEAQIFFQTFVFTFLITGLEKMLLRGRN